MITQSEKEILSHLLSEAGYMISCDACVTKQLIEYLSSLPDDLIALLSQIEVLFLFDSGPEEGQDGVCIAATERQSGIQAAIVGVGVSAIRKGRDYCVMVLLHELCHSLTHDYEHKSTLHGGDFQQYLDYLISQFNDETGSEIKNDYFGYRR